MFQGFTHGFPWYDLPSTTYYSMWDDEKLITENVWSSTVCT